MTLEVSGGILGKSSGPDNFDAMPTVAGDPVVESGSNSDGSWTRWADGTQYCSGGNTETLDITTSSSLGGYLANGAPLTFPLPFVNTVFPVFAGSGTVGNVSSPVGGSTTTDVRYRTTGASSSVMCTSEYIAFGRYK